MLHTDVWREQNPRGLLHWQTVAVIYPRDERATSCSYDVGNAQLCELLDIHLPQAAKTCHNAFSHFSWVCQVRFSHLRMSFFFTEKFSSQKAFHVTVTASSCESSCPLLQDNCITKNVFNMTNRKCYITYSLTYFCFIL